VDLQSEIRIFKQEHYSPKNVLPVGTEANIRGYLRPVRTIKKDAILMARWRRDNFDSFFTWIQPDEEEMLTWLERYEKDNNSIIFIVETAERHPVGQMSLYNVDGNLGSAEFGRLIRGAKEDFPQNLVRDAVSSLLLWCFDTLLLSKISLEVFSDNRSALTLYKKLGFRITDTLIKVKTISEEGIVQWINADSDKILSDRGNIRHAVKMIIERKDVPI
jgi:RimJ/RimL family protein N-acetyltransferase